MSIVELCWWCKRDGHKLETSKLKTRCQIERKKILNRIYMCMSYHPDIHIKYLLAKFICDNLCIKTWIDGRYSCSYYDTGYYLQNKYIESRKYRKFFGSIRTNYGRRIGDVKYLKQYVEKDYVNITNYIKYINNVYDLMLKQIESYRTVTKDIIKFYDNMQKSLSDRAEQYECEEKLLQSIYNMTVRHPEHALSQMNIVTMITESNIHFPSACSDSIKQIYEKLRKNDIILNKMCRYTCTRTDAIQYLSLNVYMRINLPWKTW